jgi:transposase InsO family protein
MEMVTAEAEKRAKIISYFEKWGLQATMEAFGVRKSSIYRWKKLLKKSSGRLDSLNNNSRAPVRKRQPQVEAKIVQFIEDLRQNRHDIGKEKIKIFLDNFCRENGLKSISVSSIGRTIKRHKFYFHKELSRTGKMKTKKWKHKERRKGYLPERPGDLMQIDSIYAFEKNVKMYVLTAIDLKSRFAFAFSYPSLSSKSGKDFMNKLIHISPFPIKRIQTDNGSEFHAFFEKMIKENRITHFFNYPRHPQQNCFIERFNRTLEDECLSSFEQPLNNIPLFNSHLLNYLIYYNMERPHKSLGYTPPSSYLINSCNFSNMSWTSTIN